MGSHYEKFMKMFPGRNTFQVFGDSKNLHPMVMHDPTPQHLTNLNSKGYGIFLTINKTDGSGRKKENITDVRAVFADLDGVPVEQALDDGPAMVVESSPGKYHCYWLVRDSENTSKFPLQGFSQVQKAIAYKYKSDQSVCDLGRVMRVPGFYHLKGDPCPVQVVYENPEFKAIDFAQAVEKWPPEPQKKWSSNSTKKTEIHSGESCKITVGETIPELLERFGWKYYNGRNWTRPGKRHGVSGTLLDDGLFFCHTSSTCLKAQGACDAFEIYAAYEFSGDKSKAAKHLLKVNR